MKIIRGIVKFFSLVWGVVGTNAAFVVFMYALGCLSSWLTLAEGKDIVLYENLYPELFLDVILLAVILCLMPRCIKPWVRGLFYVVAYSLALIDTYCFVNFASPITPTMLMLVGETNSKEAGEFLQSFFSLDLLFSKVGWIVLLLLCHVLWAIVCRYRTKILGRLFPKASNADPSAAVVTDNVVAVEEDIASSLAEPEAEQEAVAQGKDPNLEEAAEEALHNAQEETESVAGACQTDTSEQQSSPKGNNTISIKQICAAVAGIVLIVLYGFSISSSIHNKQEIKKMFSETDIGRVEFQLTQKGHAEMYQPIYRLVFSLYANSLTGRQLVRMKALSEHVEVDSCSFTSPNIVLIIGESYNRHHSQQYGYFMNTTPRQVALQKTRRLIPYSDVVTPWNLTSYVFKHLLTTYTVGDKGEWCDYPLFPQTFRTAGYHVAFITNQFLPKAKEQVYDFSGGFFLNDPQLDSLQFDTRNSRIYEYDEGLLSEYDSLKTQETDHNLTIFHLMGQHVRYLLRFPPSRKHFQGNDYKEKRSDIPIRERMILADYDNAVLYNDSIVDQIVKRFDDKDAIIIYVADHGEECFERGRRIMCRIHSARINKGLAQQEFEIPFWVYCTRTYKRNHPEIYRQIVKSKDRRLMIDALPHMLLYLGGIHSKDYRAVNNILSDEYNEMRPRLLKHVTDYDKLK